MHRKIITCRVFRDALSFLDRNGSIPRARVRCLPAFLHMNPHELRQKVVAEITASDRRRESVCCLYGDCFPDIDQTLQGMSVRRVACRNCYESLLGRRRFQRLLDRHPGTFFLEKELLLNFDEYCWQPMELDDPVLRRWFFEHYRRAVYIRQPLDPDLKGCAEEISHRLELALAVADADYTDLHAALNRTLAALA
jgi:hypothetical protein